LIDMKQEILSYLKAECPWRDTLLWHNCTDSTNLQAKLLARQGAAHGTVVLAGQQTAGRGRLGRSFDSQAGMGVYLSLILRPNCKPDKLMHLTCAAGTAMCDAVAAVAGFKPQLKWINDLVYGDRKLGGILTELSVDPETGLVDFAIVGIGINCRQKQEDFPVSLQSMAASLSAVAGKDISPARLAAAMVEALWQMDRTLLSEKEKIMNTYKENCITLGKDIQVLRADTVRPGKAIDMDEDGGLWVEYPDGSRELINSGEVSVRGMYGYL
jgi:BirA family biotin operon repressor/biotin-[acetyl-CoA-carboxylase] ligase